MNEHARLSTGTTLYYPYIHPREINHVKSALLYWDRVRRIVPNSVTHGTIVMGDSDEARVLADNGLLVATRPEPYEDEAAARFFQHIEPQGERFRIDIDTARDLARRNRGIHVEKIGGSALMRLRDLGLAHSFGEWVAMRDEVGAFYMFCLASEMGRRIGSPLMSDSIDDSTLGQSLLFEPDSATDTDGTSGVLVRMGLTLPSPPDLQHVPMAKIVDFAQRRAAERQRFRETIEGIMTIAGSATDPNQLSDYLAAQRIQIADAVNDVRDTMGELHVGTAWSTAKITLPTALAAVVDGVSVSIPSVALAILGLTISAVSCYGETRGRLRKAKIASPYHYLMSLENEFGIRTTRHSH